MPLRILLVASISLNLILAGMLLRKPSAGHVPAFPKHFAKEQTGFAKHSLKTNIVRLDWRSVESADYKEYVRNLRAIGCPEETIFDIIVADVNTLYAMKARLVVPAREWRFWEPGDLVPSREDIQSQKLRRELENEKRDLIAAILGPEALEKLKKYQLWGGEDIADRKLAFLSNEKRSQLKRLEEKYFDLEQSVSEWNANGVMTEAAVQKLAELQKQRRAEIESLLTPEELLDFDLRMSETAEQLRHELVGFHPTEQEFRKLYQVRKNFEEIMTSTANVRDPAAFEKRIETEKQLSERARADLGDQRYEEYLRSRDIDYQNTLRLTQFFGLPEKNAAEVYDLKKQDAAIANQINTDTSLSEQQRDEAFARMQANAENRLKEILGERVFDEYRRNNRWWMRNQ